MMLGVLSDLTALAEEDHQVGFGLELLEMVNE
jgi:hypothetical protein